MTRLCDIAEIRAGYPFRGAVPNMSDGLYQVVQPKDVIGGGIIADVPVCFTPKHFKKGYLLKAEDVLLSSRGEFKAALYQGAHDAIASNLLFVLSVRDKHFLPKFLVFYLNSKSGQAQMSSRRNPGTLRVLKVWIFRRCP